MSAIRVLTIEQSTDLLFKIGDAIQKQEDRAKKSTGANSFRMPLSPLPSCGGLLSTFDKPCSRDNFLDNALNRFLHSENDGKSLLTRDTFTDFTYHVTFRSHDGKVYSWLEDTRPGNNPVEFVYVH
jgi:hypothetical protein